MPVLIQTKGLRREFGDTVAVDDMDLAIEEGSVFALIGPNGAGKTTLLRLIAALVEPTSGTAIVDGRDVRDSPREVHARVGYLPDFYGLYEELTVRQYLRYFHLAYGLPPESLEPRIRKGLEDVGLLDKADAPIETLSRGMKQRVGLARTLLHEPKLLLLDEPAAGLDPGARNDFQELLKKLAREGKTIIVSSHILAELEDYCSHVAVLDRGKLAFSGSIPEARRALRGGRKFRVRLLEASDAAAALIKGRPAVSRWTPQDGGGTFEFAGDDAQSAELLAQLVAGGAKVVFFGEVAGTIQDSYLALLGREAR
jgi:ABC-2 type transport system ATP-binding protein